AAFPARSRRVRAMTVAPRHRGNPRPREESPGARRMNPNLSRGHGLADSASLATLKVDVIADLACPWCWLGKRRLDDALLAVRGPSQVRWYPLLVNPGLPEDGMTFAEYLEARCGDPEHVEQRLEELTLAGRAEGI